MQVCKTAKKSCNFATTEKAEKTEKQERLEYKEF
jgi:hypothetical protein